MMHWRDYETIVSCRSTGDGSKSEVDTSSLPALIFHKHHFWHVLSSELKSRYWLKEWESSAKLLTSFVRLATIDDRHDVEPLYLSVNNAALFEAWPYCNWHPFPQTVKTNSAQLSLQLTFKLNGTKQVQITTWWYLNSATLVIDNYYGSTSYRSSIFVLILILIESQNAMIETTETFTKS